MKTQQRMIIALLYASIFVFLSTPMSLAQESNEDNFNFVCPFHCQDAKNKAIVAKLKPVLENQFRAIEKWFQEMGFGQTNYAKHYIVLYDSTQKSEGRAQLYTCDGGKAVSLACYDSRNEFISINFSQLQTSAQLKTFSETIAHEIFHSVQRTDMPDWLGEATAEAVGRAYLMHVENKTSPGWPLKKWDAPIYTSNKTEEYRLNRFFLWLGQKLSSKDGVNYLKHFTRVKTLDDFDTALEMSAADSFYDLLPGYIAKKHNDVVGYSATLKETNGQYTLKKTDISFSGEQSSTMYSKFAVKKLSAYPNYIQAKYKTVPDNDIEKLRFIEVKIDKADDLNDLKLVYEDTVHENTQTVKIITKAEPEVNLGLTRIVNTNLRSNDTKDQNGRLSFLDQNISLDAKTCVEPKETMEFTFTPIIDGYYISEFDYSYSFSEIDNNHSLILHSSHGKMLSQDVWRAPEVAGEVSFDLEIKDYVKSDDKTLNGKTKSVWLRDIYKTSVSKNCGIRMQLSSGESMIYDAEKDISQFKDGADIMLLKEPNIYVFDPKEGWCTLDFDFVSKMMLNRTAGAFGSNKNDIIDALKRSSEYLKPYDPQSSIELREEAKIASKTNVVTTEEGNTTLKLPDQPVLLPAGEVKNKFDFYRLPAALNNMLSLKRFQEIMRLRQGKNFIV